VWSGPLNKNEFRREVWAWKSRHSTEVSWAHAPEGGDSDSTLGFGLFILHLFFSDWWRWLLDTCLHLLLTEKVSCFAKLG
jgi:hypothetical protein